jgi:prophage antirepressor-like protein
MDQKDFAYESTLIFDGYKILMVCDKKDNRFFSACDTARALGYSNIDTLTRVLRRDDRIYSEKYGVMITEGGLYELISLNPDRELAGKFRYWLTHEVAVQIRKTGSYRTTAIDEPMPMSPTQVDNALRTLLDCVGSHNPRINTLERTQESTTIKVGHIQSDVNSLKYEFKELSDSHDNLDKENNSEHRLLSGRVNKLENIVYDIRGKLGRGENERVDTWHWCMFKRATKKHHLFKQYCVEWAHNHGILPSPGTFLFRGKLGKQEVGTSHNWPVKMLDECWKHFLEDDQPTLFPEDDVC